MRRRYKWLVVFTVFSLLMLFVSVYKEYEDEKNLIEGSLLLHNQKSQEIMVDNFKDTLTISLRGIEESLDAETLEFFLYGDELTLVLVKGGLSRELEEREKEVIYYIAEINPKGINIIPIKEQFTIRGVEINQNEQFKYIKIHKSIYKKEDNIYIKIDEASRVNSKALLVKDDILIEKKDGLYSERKKSYFKKVFSYVADVLPNLNTLVVRAGHKMQLYNLDNQEKQPIFGMAFNTYGVNNNQFLFRYVCSDHCAHEIFLYDYIIDSFTYKTYINTYDYFVFDVDDKKVLHLPSRLNKIIEEKKLYVKLIGNYSDFTSLEQVKLNAENFSLNSNLP